MPLQTEQCIVAIHAHAVINYFNQSGAAAFNFYLYLAGTCINRVLKKLFDD